MKWYSGAIPEAIAEAKKNNKILLVYIEGTDDMSKQMTQTYNDNSVTEKLSVENIVALNISVNSVSYQQFSAIYPVLVIPSSFFIQGNGQPMEIITGILSPDEFKSKVDKVFEMHQKCIPKQVPASGESLEPRGTNVSIPSTSAIRPESELPSTSQTATVAESSIPLEDRIERAKVLIEAKKQMKETEEKEKEKNEEMERRNVGKAIQKANETKKDNELKEWAKNRAKEKEEERLAREKVKAMIAQDRAERAARYQMTKEAEQAERENLARKRAEIEKAAKDAAMNSNEARIQFRLPNGSFSNHNFSADATLEDARQFVIQEVRPPFSNFSLCATFPRRHFSEINYPESLRDLQLAPSAVLLILPSQAITSTDPNVGFFSSLFWLILSPVTTIWSWVRSLWPRSNQESTGSQTRQGHPASESSSSSQANVRQRQNPQRSKEPAFSKREGNIFRINNQSDDEENNTYNGNSTQQM